MSKLSRSILFAVPSILGAVLAVASSAIADEVPVAVTNREELISATDQPASSLEQTNTNPDIQKPNTQDWVSSVSHVLDGNSNSVLRKSIVNQETSATATEPEKLVSATDQPAKISSESPINLQTQESNTLAQATSVSQPSDLSKMAETVTEKANLTQPSYSLKAGDLQLDTQSRYSFNPARTNEISEAVTQNPNQPENLRLVQNEEPKTGENEKPKTGENDKPKTGESEPQPDKSQYNLFNPTPRNLRRDFSTDRPDKTETPFTVDAGNFTMEADLFIYTRDRNSADGTRTESFNFFVPNFKVGLTNNIDLQIIPEVYNIVRTTPRGGRTEENSGFGDITIRVKANFWGNDGGTTAFGIMPFIKLPTNQNNLGNNSIEGGVIFPFAVSLSDQWDVGMQTEFDFNKNDASSGYNLGFVNTISFGYQINSRWSSYFELFTEKTTATGSQFVATFDTGLKYLLTEDIQLDAGVNIGLTQAANDFQPFMGVSVRF